MVNMEARELRDAAYKCVESEMRVKLLEGLVRKNLGLKEVEDFVRKERGKLRMGGGSKMGHRNYYGGIKMVLTRCGGKQIQALTISNPRF